MTQLELTALRNMHMLGYFGFPFSAQSYKKRGELIKKWQADGLLDKNCCLTKKGIEATLPSAQHSKQQPTHLS